jgi:hypothetical protein
MDGDPSTTLIPYGTDPVFYLTPGVEVVSSPERERRRHEDESSPENYYARDYNNDYSPLHLTLRVVPTIPPQTNSHLHHWILVRPKISISNQESLRMTLEIISPLHLALQVVPTIPITTTSLLHLVLQVVLTIPTDTASSLHLCISPRKK